MGSDLWRIRARLTRFPRKLYFALLLDPALAYGRLMSNGISALLG